MNSNKKFYTDFLVPKSSFITGVGSVICLGGWNHRYNISNSKFDADTKAIKNDWNLVGSDLRTAINNNYVKIESR